MSGDRNLDVYLRISQAGKKLAARSADWTIAEIFVAHTAFGQDGILFFPNQSEETCFNLRFFLGELRPATEQEFISHLE